MHWLYFGDDSPKTLEAAGFDYDSTCGYNDAVGYRAGTSQVFLWSSARVAGVPVCDAVAKRNLDADEFRRSIEGEVRYANITIIEGHDASQYGIGIVSARIAEIVLGDDHAAINLDRFDVGEIDRRALARPRAFRRSAIDLHAAYSQAAALLTSLPAAMRVTFDGAHGEALKGGPNERVSAPE